jgi:phage terminase Nu1 subunit (DNA packaging protein)
VSATTPTACGRPLRRRGGFPSDVEGRGGEALAVTAAAERARLARAHADKIELANARTRGVLLDAGAVEAEWSGVLRFIRAGMLAVPYRCARPRLPHLTPQDVIEIDGEVRAVLTEIGSGS